ncbi:tRNA preQ1(34) S-adenosylmethionine ribosyltransferase-isomerase QueA [Patescibacteria group bacterium]|nr:MAG: tRNA preQ1(34) S-adenosylmethionine ribosyltransferase-isomerase QueA [Patescibacteria group bacterium]
MKTALFDYLLPPERIAQKPVRPRDHSRLLVLDPVVGTMKHRRFFEIGDFLNPGDLLVVNDTKVFKARLTARRATGGKVEVFLLRALTDGKAASEWECLLKPGKKVRAGGALVVGRVPFTVLRKNEDGVVVIHAPLSADNVIDFANHHGAIPVPPYVCRAPKTLADYQTVYAKKEGSVAAPTAGFHFTPQLIARLKKRGIRFASVTLHVGIGTFRPVSATTLEEHEMHAEWGEIPAATRRAIIQTRKKSGRVIAVGTTTVRALEGLGREPSGWVDIFIRPGYRFRVVDALITNFHLPRSTLLALVSALAGRAFVLAAYAEAVKKKYRFYSFGDAMFVTRRV